MRRNLVIVRAGDRSLHPQWMDAQDRDWDIAVSCYGDFPERYRDQFDHLHVFKGSKWEGISDYIKKHPSLIERYQYVWLPDDDILTNSRNIDDFFRICEQLDLTIAQPALTENSYHTWTITIRQQGLMARMTNFVEIMAPCFKAAELFHFSEFFSENTSGWGYEWLWLKIAKEVGIFRFAIIDHTPVYHTRPVGRAGHGGSKISPIEELREFLLKFNVVMENPVVLQCLISRQV